MRGWLLLMMTLVICMISLGGYVRLSGSGLSMTSWQPTKILPPLSPKAWKQEFARYRDSPEFRHVNSYFSLEDFKKIFWPEYLHRLLGRLLGLLAILPLFFYRKFSRKQIYFVLMIIVLIGLQGLMGWLMVKSGLINSPQVSHLRLAAHLLLAFLLLGVLSLQFFASFQCTKIYICSRKRSQLLLQMFIWIILMVCVLQIGYGGLTAGLGAGRIFNTFPLMDEELLPDFLNMTGIFSEAATVQFAHRMLGMLLFLLISSYFIISLFFWRRLCYLLPALLLLFIISGQFSLGIITLLTGAKMGPAMLHQLGAIILFLMIIFCICWQRRAQVLT